MPFDESTFDELAQEVAFCLANIRHPACTMQHAGRSYEDAAEALRAHAILRLLVDGNPAVWYRSSGSRASALPAPAGRVTALRRRRNPPGCPENPAGARPTGPAPPAPRDAYSGRSRPD